MMARRTLRAVPGVLLLLACIGSAAAGAGDAKPSVREPDQLGRGIAYYQEGSYEEAENALVKARLKDPGSSRAAFYLGATLKKMQQYDKALSHLKDAVTLQPPAKEAFPELADVYYLLGRNDEALHALDVAEGAGVAPGQTAFLRGLIFMKKRKDEDAIASFQRAKTADPKLMAAADYQIAVVYQRRGDQEKALEEFNAVIARDPDSAAGQMAKQQADALIRQSASGSPFNAVVSVQEQYDSNVILKPDNAAAAAAISGESDLVTVVSARLEYAAPVRLPYSLKAQYALYLNRHQDLKTYDVQSHSIGLIPGYALGENSLALLASYNVTLVDGEQYLQALLLSPLYIYTPADEQQAHIALRFLRKDFQQTPPQPDEDRDSTDVGLGISWYWMFGQRQGFINARYEINREDAQGANWSYLGNKAAVGCLYPFTDAWKASAGLEVYLQDYDNSNTAFNEKRKDTTTTLTVQALYALTKSIDAHLQYVYMKDDSTIDVYAFTKYLVGIGLFARF
jgi:Tfp pilus assembly protein PilF